MAIAYSEDHTLPVLLRLTYNVMYATCTSWHNSEQDIIHKQALSTVTRMYALNKISVTGIGGCMHLQINDTHVPFCTTWFLRQTLFSLCPLIFELLNSALE